MSQNRNCAGQEPRRACPAAKSSAPQSESTPITESAPASMATFEYSPVLHPRYNSRARAGSHYELLGDAHLARPRAIVIGVVTGVFLPVGSALAAQSSRIPPQAVGERDQVPARNAARFPGRTGSLRRGFQLPHRPRLGMNVHQHLRPETGREGKRPRRLDQVETIEPPSEPLVEFDAGERRQAQRGEETASQNCL